MYYLESNSTKYRIIHTLRKICQRTEQINVNMVSLMHKFAHRNEQKVWRIGYRNMQIIGKIWWILPKVGKKYGGY